MHHRLMKWVLAILVATAFAVPSWGQQITVSVKNSPLSEVLSVVEKQGDFKFFYSSALPDLDRKVSIDVQDKPLKAVLDVLFSGTAISYEIKNPRLVVLSPRLRKEEAPKTQERKVSGTVIDSDGVPVIAMSVLEEGTSNGTMTDADGKYTITLIGKDPSLRYEALGYKVVTEKVAGRAVIDITTEVEAIALDAVVAIGYGTAKKRDLTTAISTVSTDDMKTRPITDAAGFIQGKVAGVTAQQTSGLPGSGMTIRVRGASSIASSNDPLYVVDGVPVGEGSYAIAYLSPSDIESMQILKDASSAAIYGSRAANGVVLITTKGGKAGKGTQISFNSYVGLTAVARTFDVLNHEQYKELLVDEGLQSIVEEMPYGLKDETDWMKETYRNGLAQNYQLSVSNATDKAKYYASAGYSDETGVIRSTYSRRFNMKVNTEWKLFDWLRFGTDIAYSNGRSNGVNTGMGANNGGVVISALCTPTYAKVWDEANPEYYWTNFYGLSGLNSPVENIARTQNNFSSYDRLIASGALTVDIVKGLRFKSTVSMDRRWGHGYTYLDPVSTVFGRKAHGSVTDTRNDDRRMIYDNILTYNGLWGGHSLEAMVGTSATTSDYQALTAGKNYLMSDHSVFGLNAGNKPGSIGQNWSKWSIMSYLGRISYNYSSRYYITANFRADGSSKLAPGHKWGFFPSVSAAWRISGEPWMEGVSWLDDLKLRAGWGQLGNQAGLADYAWVEKYGITYYDYTKPEYATAVPTIGNLSAMGNTDLTWETTNQANVGIDFSMLGGRLNLTMDGYYKYTTDLLLNVPLPSTAKVGSIYRNEGEMSNWGIEFSLNSVNIDRNNFRWNTDFNIFMNRNRLESLRLQKIYYFAGTSDQQGRESVIRMEEGHPLSQFYGYVSRGVDSQTGNIVYEDRNNDGRITDADKTWIGDANPDFTFGLTNTLTWKGLSLSFLITGSVGNDIYNASRVELVSMNNGYNQITDVLRRWRSPGDVTDMPKAGGTDNLKVSSRFVEDGSYVKLKNITLSYDIRHHALKKAHISSIRPYITCGNVLTLTKYSGYDPEVSEYTAATKMGVDWGSYPNVKTFIFGLNVEF